MIWTIDLDEPTAVAVDGGELTVSTIGKITVRNGEVESSILLPGLGSSDSIEIWSGDSWCCLVGSEHGAIVVAEPFCARIRVVGEVPRLDLSGSYDPGGLHYVRFAPIGPAEVLVMWEFGVARVGIRAGLRWKHFHFDLSARVESVDDEVVRIAHDDVTESLRLEDGSIKRT